jgi:hypothetical protein
LVASGARRKNAERINHQSSRGERLNVAEFDFHIRLIAGGFFDELSSSSVRPSSKQILRAAGTTTVFHFESLSQTVLMRRIQTSFWINAFFFDQKKKKS